MATYTGKYDPNIDYAAAIAKATSPEQAKVLEAQRNMKIADMNETGTNKSGYTETYVYNKPTLSEPEVEKPDYYSQLQSSMSNLYALQEKARLDALKAAQSNAYAALDKESKTIDPAYRTGMTNVASTANLQARNLAEYLAQRGQTSSGISSQARMNIYGNAMGQQSALEQQRANAIADIESRRTAAQTAYDAGAVQAATERSISETQGLIDLANQERETSIATIGQYYDDYAAKMNEIEALEAKGDYSQSYLLPYLEIARNEKLAALAEQANAVTSGTYTPTYEPTLTAAQAKDAYNDGVRTQTVVDAYNYYYGANMSSSYDEAERLLSQRTVPSSQLALIEAYYNQGKITEAEAQALLDKYGLR